MNKEIEVLVEVFDKKANVLKKLKGFKFEGAKKTLDIYFFDPKRKNLKPHKDCRLKECLRIRTKSNKSYLAYKIDHFNKKGIWSHSDEHEIEISNSQTALKIIEHLGFKELVKLENTKHTFLSDKYEIVFEDVKNLGIFLEVEAINAKPHESVKKVKIDILKFIESLNIKTGPELNSGKPELLLKKIN
jgi:predicted adenylyl cyclase CyaB